MQTTLKTPRVEDLLEHADWLRGLATRLVRGADAEDLVQETWMAAMRSPPAGDASEAQPWLARVLRNLALGRFRAQGVRRRAEPQVAELTAGEAPPSPEALLQRARVQRELAELVAELDEPVRTAMLLRYYEGMSGAEIARALGVPAGTIRWRLHEGTTQLRARLDALHDGDSSRWRALLAPLSLPAGGGAGGTSTSETPASGSVGRPAAGWGGAIGWVGAAVLVAGVALVAAKLLGGSGDTPPQATLATAAPAAGPGLAPAADRRASLLRFDPAEAPGTVTGRVLDPQGQPVSGARVVALLEAETGREAADLAARLRPAAAAISDGDGRFRLEPLPPGSYALGATAAARGAASRAHLVVLSGEPVAGIDLRLGAGERVFRGKVVDAGGGPIAGAAVRAVSRPAEGETPRLFEALSSGDGAYTLPLPPAAYVLTAAADGYAPSADHFHPASDQPLDFRLEPAGRVRGRVVERATGAPASHATVNAQPWSDPQGPLVEVQADAAGRFELANLPPGAYRLSAQREAALGGWPEALAVGVGPLPAEIEIAVSRAAVVSGRTLDPDGQPLANARLRLLRDKRWNPAAAPLARSSADGRFRFAGVPPGQYLLLVEAPGHAPAERALTVTTADQPGIEVALTAGATLTGLVLDARGRPVQGAVVWAYVHEQDRAPVMDRSALAARTGPDGRFLLRGLGAGTARVSAWHPEHGSAVGAPITLAAGETRPLELNLGSGTYLEGVVRRDGGKPAGGVRVVAGWREPDGFGVSKAFTAADGRFRIGPVRPGPVTLVASPRLSGAVVIGTGSPHQSRLDVQEGETRAGVLLVLPAHSLAISGRIVLSDGTPLEGARLLAEPDMDGDTWTFGEPLAQTLSGADGTFRFDPLDPGPHTLRIEHAGHPARTLEAVAAGTAGLEVKLDPPGQIRGVVTGPDGRPAERFAVRALRRDGEGDGGGGDRLDRLDPTAGHLSRGAFQIDGLRPGSYDVEAVTPDGLVGRGPGLSLASGGRAEVNLRLGAGATLRVRVSDFDTGEPMAGVRILAHDSGHALGAAVTDGTGHATVAGLAPGAKVHLKVPADLLPGHRTETLTAVTPAAGAGSQVLAVRLLRMNPRTWMGGPLTGGVGLRLEREGDRLLVREAFAGRPAAQAGVQPGDTIVSVDGKSIEGLGPLGLTDVIRGAPGTVVTLGLSTRAGPRTVPLTRSESPASGIP